MSDYRSGYGNGKALGHAMHCAEALEETLAIAGANHPPAYRRGLEDGFRDGWDAWRYEVSLPTTDEGRALLLRSWEQHLGKRYTPEQEATG